jgi:L-iditol 2-dehydrogenase
MEGRRVVWVERGRAELETFAVPEPKPGQVLIESEVTLISPGTERAFFLSLPNAQGRFPGTPGYCCAGRVAALGEGVEGLEVGERVVAATNHCSHSLARAGQVWKVPEGLEPEQAAFFNLGAIALQGVRKARVELGESTAVVGLGLIGNLALQLARLQGALPAIGVDPDAWRREVAMACGADRCEDPTAEGASERLAAEGGPAVVIEATGHAEPVNDAFAMAGHHARVVLLASTRGVTETNFYRDVHKKGLTVLGAHAHVRPATESSPGYWTQSEDVATVLRLLAAGRLQVAPLTSKVFAWADAPKAYDILASWRKDLLGMLIDWRAGPGG